MSKELGADFRIADCIVSQTVGEKTENGQKHEPNLSRDASARMAWLDDRMQRASARAWEDIGLSWRHTSVWDAVDEAMDAEGQ